MAEIKSFNDEVIEKAVAFGQKVVEAVVRRYPQPVGRRKLSQKEQLQRYMQLRPDDMNKLVQQHGPAAVESYIYNMEKLKQRLGGI